MTKKSDLGRSETSHRVRVTLVYEYDMDYGDYPEGLPDSPLAVAGFDFDNEPAIVLESGPRIETAEYL